MIYDLFTYPNCGKCTEIKEYLEETNLEGQVHDLSSAEGIIKVKKVYPKIRDRVQRDNNGIKTPLILLSDDKRNIIEVIQDKEGLVACLSKD